MIQWLNDGSQQSKGTYFSGGLLVVSIVIFYHKDVYI